MKDVKQMEEKDLPLMLDDTIKAFDCCVQMPPLCDDCPLMNDLCGKYVKKGREKLKDSVHYWLSQIEQQ